MIIGAGGNKIFTRWLLVSFNLEWPLNYGQSMEGYPIYLSQTTLDIMCQDNVSVNELY